MHKRTPWKIDLRTDGEGGVALTYAAAGLPSEGPKWDAATVKLLQASAKRVQEKELEWSAGLTAQKRRGGPAAEAGSLHARLVEMLKARLQHGQLLLEHLDGPGRRLSLTLDDHRSGRKVDLFLRLVSSHGEAEATHPGVGLRFELLANANGFVFERADAPTLTIQLGTYDLGDPEVLPRSRLRVLFMAYSPKDVEPVLDFEREEESIQSALAPFVATNRALLHVVEGGSLRELEHQIKLCEYDIVILSGHGMLRPEGAVLVMETETGGADFVGCERLVHALQGGPQPPRLVVVSSCHSGEHQTDTPSLVAGLVARGIPAAIGWTRPVADELAIEVEHALIDRLATGCALPDAIAQARYRLVQAEEEPPKLPKGHKGPPPPKGVAIAAGTFHYLAHDPAGFRVDSAQPADDGPLTTTTESYEWLAGEGKMKVLREGFVGRRRELQEILRTLKPGDKGQTVAGVLLLGMKGTGKSCLAARALSRMTADRPQLRPLVLHGELTELVLSEAFVQLAKDRGDKAALAELAPPSSAFDRGTPTEPLLNRIERVLRVLRRPPCSRPDLRSGGASRGFRLRGWRHGSPPSRPCRCPPGAGRLEWSEGEAGEVAIDPEASAGNGRTSLLRGIAPQPRRPRRGRRKFF